MHGGGNMDKINQPLTNREKVIVNGIIAGKPKAVIAREMGINRSTVYHSVYRPHVAKYLKDYQDLTEQKRLAAVDKYNDMVFEALEVAQDIMLNGSRDIDKIKALDIILKGAPMMKTAIQIEMKQKETLASAALKSLASIGTTTPEIDGTLADLEEEARIQREKKLEENKDA